MIKMLNNKLHQRIKLVILAVTVLFAGGMTDCIGIMPAKVQAAAVKDYKELEEVIVTAIKNRESSIDVLSFGLNEDEFGLYWDILGNNPELFYAYVTTSKLLDKESGKIKTILPKYAYDEEETATMLNQMDAVADKAISLLDEDMSDYEKALIVHEWLVKWCEYDPERLPEGTFAKESYRAYGALVNRRAVCNGYSEAYIYILKNKLGINCYYTRSPSMNHGWNIVELDGKFYHVDVTWDDHSSTDEVKGRFKHSCFLVTDDEIKNQKHIVEDEYNADDTTYQNAHWKNTIAQIIYHNGFYYFINNNDGVLYKTDDMFDGALEKVFALDVKYISYARLFEYGGNLIFNGAKEIYFMPFDTEKVYTLYKLEGDSLKTYYIFDLYVAGDTVECAEKTYTNYPKNEKKATIAVSEDLIKEKIEESEKQDNNDNPQQGESQGGNDNPQQGES